MIKDNRKMIFFNIKLHFRLFMWSTRYSWTLQASTHNSRYTVGQMKWFKHSFCFYIYGPLTHACWSKKTEVSVVQRIPLPHFSASYFIPQQFWITKQLHRTRNLKRNSSTHSILPCKIRLWGRNVYHVNKEKSEAT